jgi:photosystem II stability/assembly factor-like uncharacterized protein
MRFTAFTVGVIALLLTLSFLPASAQLSQWTSLNPTRDGTTTPTNRIAPAPFLYGVKMLTSAYGWAVGGTCNIYTGTSECPGSGFALFWDGTQWRQTLVPASAYTLTSVSIVSANNVWAVGKGSTIIHWDGTSWATVPVPLATTIDLFSVFILPGGLDGWAVGNSTAPANILRWSGAWPTGTWSVVAPNPPASSSSSLRGVYLISSTDGWTVGMSGTIFHWDGAGWTDVSATSPTANHLYSVFAVSSTDAWAVGASSTIIRWNGASWTGPMVAPTIGIDYHSVHMVTVADGWIAGNLISSTGEGLLLRWDGTAWSMVRSYVTVNLNNITMLPLSGGTNGVSVGDAETIIRWDGSTWFAQTSPTFADISALYLVTSSDGWAVGRNGTIFRWNGQSWNHYETLPSGISLNGLFMRTSTDAWAVGNATNHGTPPTILRWNGVAWSAITPPGVALGQNLTDVFMISATEGWAVGTGSVNASAATLKWDGALWTSVPSGTLVSSTLWSVHMLSSTDGWAVGMNQTGTGPVIIRWSGLAWSTVTAPPGIAGLRSVHFLSASNGWAVGNQTTDGRASIIHWDGAQWTRVSAPPGNLVSVYMTSASDGWAVGQNPADGLSLIVHWDGLTWNVVSTLPLPPTLAVSLNSVFMVTPLDGWIACNQGLILHYGPEVVPGTTTSMTTVIETTTSTLTESTTSTTSTTNSTSTTSSTTTTTSIPPSPVPGFPIESIIVGLAGGLIALTVIRHRRRL